MKHLIPSGMTFLGFMDGMNIQKENGKTEGVRFTRDKSCLLSHPNAKDMYVVPNVKGEDWPSAKSYIRKSKVLYKKWSHYPVREEVLIKRPEVDSFKPIGNVLDVFYTSDKFSKIMTKYYHEFERMPVVMRGIRKGRTVSNVFKISPVRITSAGIEDCYDI